MLFSQAHPFVRQAILTRLDSRNGCDLFQKLRGRDSRLFYVIAGSGTIRIEEESYPIAPATIILIRAGVEYEWQIREMDYYVINFDFDMSYSHIRQRFHPYVSSAYDPELTFACEDIEDFPALNKPLVLQGASALRRAVEQLVTESAIRDEYTDLLLSASFSAMLARLLRLYRHPALACEGREALVRQIIEDVYVHYAGELDVGIIARRLNYNPAYVGRMFRQHTGVALPDFICSHRLDMAMELLSSGALPIGQIGRSVGFRDVYHFSRVFRKKTGCSPSAYRAMQTKAAPETKKVPTGESDRDG